MISHKKFRPLKTMKAFTLVELMLVVAVVAVMASIGFPLYTDHINNLKNTEAITEIKEIEIYLQRFYTENGRFPDNLNGLEARLQTDPWDVPYGYLNIENATKKGKGKQRKDKNLVPINSDYDLYSSGSDKASVGPLTAKQSHDDIVRGRNGSFVGLATEF